jgi:hypothetical protein
MSDKSYKVGRLVPQEATITEFPGFVLIEESGDHRDDEYGWAMRTEDFVRLVTKHKGHDFIFDPIGFGLSCTLFYHGIIDERLDDYIHRPQWCSDHHADVDIRRIVELGDFQNIVYDGSSDDGYLYDLNGDPVYRSFRVELGESRFRVKLVQSALLKNKKVRDLEIQNVPYYNVDSIGSREVVFNYYPDPDEFYELVEADRKCAILGTTGAIVERLRLKEFERDDS